MSCSYIFEQRPLFRLTVEIGFASTSGKTSIIYSSTPSCDPLRLPYRGPRILKDPRPHRGNAITSPIRLSSPFQTAPQSHFRRYSRQEAPYPLAGAAAASPPCGSRWSTCGRLASRCASAAVSLLGRFLTSPPCVCCFSGCAAGACCACVAPAPLALALAAAASLAAARLASFSLRSFSRRRALDSSSCQSPSRFWSLLRCQR